MKNDKLDAMIFRATPALIRQTADEVLATDTTDAAVSDAAACKIRRMIRRENRKTKFAGAYRAGKRVVAAVLIICTVTLVAILSVEDVRAESWNAVTEFFETIFTPETTAPPSCEETTEAWRMKWKMPTCYPEDYADFGNPGKKARITFTSRYFSRSRGELLYTQMEMSEGQKSWERNKDSGTEILINDLPGRYFLAPNEEGNSWLAWHDEAYFYSIMGKLTLEELLQMAESIQ